MLDIHVARLRLEDVTTAEKAESKCIEYGTEPSEQAMLRMSADDKTEAPVGRPPPKVRAK